MEDVFVCGGPPLFPPEVEAVDEVAGEPALADFGPGAIFRGVIEAADAGCSAGADDLGEIEGLISIVPASDQDASDGIPGTLAEAAMAQRVEAVVLTKDDRADASDKEVFIGRVGERMPVVTGVAGGALMELGVGVAAHRDPRLKADDDEGGVVEAVFGGQGEFLFYSLGRQLYVGRDGAEVRHDAEDALGLLVAVRTDCVWVDSGLRCRRWIGLLLRLLILQRAG